MALTYENGRIPYGAMDPVRAANGQTAWLLPNPAASLVAVQAAVQRKYGWVPLVTSAGDAFRDYERQERVFRQRYRPYYSTVMQGGRRIVDRRWWDGQYWYRYQGAAAAIPGTSNHGKGITVDITGLGWFESNRWNQFAEFAKPAGWSNAEGSRIAEPWHWNYIFGDAYEVADTNTIPGVDITLPDGTPLIPIEEDPLAKFTEDDLQLAAHNAMLGIMRSEEFARLLRDSVRTGTIGILRSPEASLIIRDAITDRADMVALIELLYQHFLDREPRPESALWWVEEAQTKRLGARQLRALFTASLAEAGTVRRAYSVHLGRAPREHEITHWADGKRTIAQVFDGVARSGEAQEKR